MKKQNPYRQQQKMNKNELKNEIRMEENDQQLAKNASQDELDIKVEELINQILPSDESADEIYHKTYSIPHEAEEETKELTICQPRSKSGGFNNVLHSIIFGPSSAQLAEDVAEQQQQLQYEVLSPSRICPNEDDDGGAVENPFEVVANQEGEDGCQTATENNPTTMIDEEKLKQIDEDDAATDTSKSANKVADLKMSKQRSNSAEIQNVANKPEKAAQKKAKRRNLMMPIFAFFHPEPSVVLATSAQEEQKKASPEKTNIIEDEMSKQTVAAAATTITESEPNSTPQPVTKERENIFSKLFSRKQQEKPARQQAEKPATPIIEETKDLLPQKSVESAKEQSVPSKSAHKPDNQRKGNELKSRFVRFFQKIKKQEDLAEPVVEISKQPAVVVEEEIKAAGDDNQQAQPQSSLDTGFSANIDDLYKEDIDGDDAPILNAANVQDEDGNESDALSNEEIYNELDGVDFRPTIQGEAPGAPVPINYQFSFNETSQLRNAAVPVDDSEETASHNSDATDSDFTSEQSQSQPSSSAAYQAALFTWNEAGGGGGHSQEATNGGSTRHSVYSLDERNQGQKQQKAGYRPRQRAHSQLNEVPSAFSQQQPNDDVEWEAYFPGATQQQESGALNTYPVEYGMDFGGPDGQYRTTNVPVRYSAGFLGHRNETVFENLSATRAHTDKVGFTAGVTEEADGSDKPPFEQFAPSQSDGQPLQMNKKDSMRRSTSYQLQDKPELFLQHFGNNAFTPTNQLLIAPQTATQMRISEPFTPTQGPSFSFFTGQQHQKPISSVGAIQDGSMFDANQLKHASGPGQTHFSDSQHYQTGGALRTSTAPFQAANTAQQFGEMQLGQGSQRSSFMSSSNQTSLSSSTNQGARNSNASNTASHLTNKDTSDSASCSEFMKRSKKRKHRRTKKKQDSKRAREVAAGLCTADSSDIEQQQQTPLICFCCSTGARTCMLELKREEFNHLMATDRMKHLIMADQELTHFQPIDMRKIGGSTTNCARACIEGRIKDDIWHECCACCPQVRNTLLSEMQGISSELCRDQLCSKFIQVQLSRCPSTEAAVIDVFFTEIVRDEEMLLLENPESEQVYEATSMAAEQPSLSDRRNSSMYAASLMKNVFGNYVAQLIFEKGTPERIDQFYSCMLKQIHRLAYDQYGCRIIQKALVWLPLERKLEIIEQFEPSKLVSMMFSEEGNYILQCMVLNLPTKNIQFLLPLIETKLQDLCRDRRGCRVIQRVLEKFPRHEIATIIDSIIKAANELTPQQYGNYVIAHILQKGQIEEKIKIFDSIMDNIVRFSLYQLGSNVVENCLKAAPEHYRETILERISAVPVATPEGSQDVSMVQLLENQFGNYVIQHAFNMSNDQRKRILNAKIEQAAAEGHVQKTNMYAKHVFALMHQYYASECNTCQIRQQRQLQSSVEGCPSSNATKDSTPFAQAQTMSQQQNSGCKAATEGLSSSEQESLRAESGRPSRSSAPSQVAAIKSAATAAKPTGTAKSAKTVEEENKEMSDEDGMSKGEDEEDLGEDGTSDPQGKCKRRRRRTRRGKAKKDVDETGTLYADDVLDRLSDQDREDYLKKRVSQPEAVAAKTSQGQSLFVFGKMEEKGGASSKSKVAIRKTKAAAQTAVSQFDLTFSETDQPHPVE